MLKKSEKKKVISNTFLKSGALSGKILLVRIIENNKIVLIVII